MKKPLYKLNQKVRLTSGNQVVTIIDIVSFSFLGLFKIFRGKYRCFWKEGKLSKDAIFNEEVLEPYEDYNEYEALF